MIENTPNPTTKSQQEEIVKLFPDNIGRIEFSDAGVEQVPPFVEMKIVLNDDPKATFDFMQKLEVLFQNDKFTEILSKVNVMKIENLKLSHELMEKRELEPRLLRGTTENTEQGFHVDGLREEDKQIFGFISPNESSQEYRARENPTIIISNEVYKKGVERLTAEMQQSGDDIKNFLIREGFTEYFSSRIAKKPATERLSVLETELNIIHPKNLDQLQNQVAFRRRVNEQCYFAFPNKGTLYLLRNDLHRHKIGNWYEVGHKKEEETMYKISQGTENMIELPVYRLRGRLIGPMVEALRPQSN